MHTAQVSPAAAAQLDWILEGAFWPERFSGQQRAEYEAAQRQIEQQDDKKPI